MVISVEDRLEALRNRLKKRIKTPPLPAADRANKDAPTLEGLLYRIQVQNREEQKEPEEQ